MPSVDLWVSPQALLTIVPAVGLVLTLVAARRLARGTVWLVGGGCAVLFATNLLWLLWVAGAGRTVEPAGTVIGKLYLVGMQLVPVAEVVGLAMVIGGGLRRTPRATAEPAEPAESAESAESAGAGVDRRPVPRRAFAGPTWALLGIAGVVGAVVGGGALAVATSTDDAVPRLVQGTVVAYSAAGPSIVFVAEGSDDRRTYPLNSRFWIDRHGGQRTDERPGCLRPGDSTPRRVELAFLDVVGGRTHGFGDFPYLLSLRCLD